jgi:polysaccharide export outer membrane protein
MAPKQASLRRLSLVVLLAASSAACAPEPPRAPTKPTDDAAFAATAPPEPPGMDDDAAPEAERLHAGDVLSVKYVGNKDTDPPNVIVDRAGGIHLPLVGDVTIGDRTLSEAEAIVQERLRRYDRFSTVSMTVLETKGRIATVTGAVEHPGNVPIVGDARLADVLATVGSVRLTTTTDRPTMVGDLDAARVVRGGKTLPIDAKLALEGAPRHNVRIHPGDVIFVPPALEGRIVVLGHVAKPQTLPYRHGLRLTEVLADSGGLTKEADSEDIRIVRGGYAHPRLFVANARDVLSAVRPDVVLAPGDVIFVTEHWFASIGEVLDRLVPATATALLFASVVK